MIVVPESEPANFSSVRATSLNLFSTREQEIRIKKIIRRILEFKLKKKIYNNINTLSHKNTESVKASNVGAL